MSLPAVAYRDSTLDVVLVGTDGQEWDLLHPYSPVWLVGGFKGLHVPDITPQVSKGARTPGQRWRGRTVEPRTLSMQLCVGDQQPPYRTGADWRDLDGDFWDSVQIGADPELVLRVGERRILCRLVDSAPTDTARDPGILGKQTYDAEFVADRPFWRTDDLTFPFEYDAAADNYYGGEVGLGPPFYISSSQVFSSAMVANPGRVDGWLRYVITGPGTVTVGIGDDLLPLPFALLPGEQVFVDTDPQRQVLIDGDGANVWPRLGTGRVSFAPVPARSSVQLVVEVTGAGPGTSIVASLTPEFYRAW